MFLTFFFANLESGRSDRICVDDADTMMIISMCGRPDVSPADPLLCRNELGSSFTYLPHQDEQGWIKYVGDCGRV